MAKEMNLTFQIGAVATGAILAFNSMQKELNKVKENTDIVVKAQERLQKTQKKLADFDKLRENFVKVNKEYFNAIQNLSKLKEEYQKTGQGNEKFAKRVKEVEKYVEKLNKQKERQKHIFKSARSELEKEGIAYDKYKERLAKANKELERQAEIKNKLKYWENASNMSKSMFQKSREHLMTGLKVGAAVAIPIKMYAELEESQADLKKMIEFRNKTEEEAYFEQIRKLSENSPLKQTEVYEIAGAAAQAGIAKENIVEFTDRAMKLKVAFGMTTEASGEFIAKSKEQLGLTQKQTFAYADVINYMADNTAAKASEMVDISNRVGGLARSQNVAKETNIALGATLLSMGTSAEVASTGLKQLYLELGKGADTKRKIAAFDFLGLDGKSINKDMAKDAEGTIVKVLEKIKLLKDEDRSAVLNDLFGEQAINSVSVLATNVDKVRENLEKAHSEMTAGSVDREYANRMNTLTNIFKKNFNILMNAFMDIGKSLAPELKIFLNQITPFLKKIGEFIKNNPKLVSGILKIGLAFSLLKLGMASINFAGGFGLGGISTFMKFLKLKNLGGFTYALKKMFPTLHIFYKLLTPVAKVGIKIGKVFGKFAITNILKFINIIKTVGVALKGLLIANPIILLIGAVAAAIYIFYKLYTKVEWFRNGVIKIFKGWITGFIGIWKVIIGIFTGNFDLIKQGFKDMISGLISIWEGLTGIISKTWDKITGFFKKTKENTKEIQNMGEKSKPIQLAYGNQRGLPYHWSGTNYFSGGLTSIAERGPEIIKLNNNSYLATAPMIANLPKGTQILNNSQTRTHLINNFSNLKNRNLSNLQTNNIKSSVKNLKDRINNISTSNNKTTYIGGDTITIHINGGNNKPVNIAREVEKVFKELKAKHKRTVIV